VKRLVFNVESPMGSQAFDSEKESDMKGEGGKTAEKALKNKYTMMVDQWGKITHVEADDDNPNTPYAEASASPDMMGNMMSQVAEGLDLPKAGDHIDLRILPADKKKGDNWSDSVEGRKTIYTLSEITESEVIINFTENGTVNRTEETMGMEMTFNSKDKSTGRIVLDRKTGILKERTSTTDSEGTLEMMGQLVPMNTKMEKKITVMER
jgi:hypothetical protein